MIGLALIPFVGLPLVVYLYKKNYFNKKVWCLFAFLFSIFWTFSLYQIKGLYTINLEKEDDDINDYKYNAGIRDTTIIFTLITIFPGLN